MVVGGLSHIHSDSVVRIPSAPTINTNKTDTVKSDSTVTPTTSTSTPVPLSAPVIETDEQFPWRPKTQPTSGSSSSSAPVISGLVFGAKKPRPVLFTSTTPAITSNTDMRNAVEQNIQIQIDNKEDNVLEVEADPVIMISKPEVNEHMRNSEGADSDSDSDGDSRSEKDSDEDNSDSNNNSNDDDDDDDDDDEGDDNSGRRRRRDEKYRRCLPGHDSEEARALEKQARKERRQTVKEQAALRRQNKIPKHLKKRAVRNGRK